MAGLCNRCEKAQATLHITDILPTGEKVEHHLCERCARDEGLTQEKAPTTSMEVLEQFVSSPKGAKASPANLVCEHCGVSYLEFRNQGVLGCPQDYQGFRDALMPLIRRAHDDATHHTGKTPRSLGQTRVTQQDVQRLRRMLADAVAAEDYERAAELRDRIRQSDAEAGA